jgi:hypothetical protein
LDSLSAFYGYLVCAYSWQFDIQSFEGLVWDVFLLIAFLHCSLLSFMQVQFMPFSLLFTPSSADFHPLISLVIEHLPSADSVVDGVRLQIMPEVFKWIRNAISALLVYLIIRGLINSR